MTTRATLSLSRCSNQKGSRPKPGSFLVYRVRRLVDDDVRPRVARHRFDPLEHRRSVGPVVVADTAASGVEHAPRNDRDHTVAGGRPEDRAAGVTVACAAPAGAVAVSGKGE